MSVRYISSQYGKKATGDVVVRVDIYTATALGRGMLGRLYPGKRTRYSFYRRLSGPQDQTGHKGVNENLHLSDTRDRTRAVQSVAERLASWLHGPLFSNIIREIADRLLLWTVAFIRFIFYHYVTVLMASALMVLSQSPEISRSSHCICLYTHSDPTSTTRSYAVVLVWHHSR